MLLNGIKRVRSEVVALRRAGIFIVLYYMRVVRRMLDSCLEIKIIDYL